MRFALLFFVPDFSMIGFIVNPRVGASLFNAVHTYLGPLGLQRYALEPCSSYRQG